MSDLVKIIADFSTTLVTKVAVGATTATLTSATDDDGIALPAGTYGFTIDRNSANKEYFTAVLSGTSLSGIKTVTRGTGVGTSGLAMAHRKGAEVIISDHVALRRMLDLLDGTTNLDSSNPLQYTAEPTFVDGNHELVTWDKAKAYTDGVAIAGGADASTSVKGITKLSTAPVSATEPIAAGTNDTRIPTQDENDALVGTSGTSVSSSNKLVDAGDVSNSGASGKIVRLNGTALPACSGASLTGVQTSYFVTTARDISAGDACVIGDGVATISAGNGAGNASGNTINSTDWVSQKFTTGAYDTHVKSIVIQVSDVNNGYGATASIRANNSSLPTGSDIGGISGTVTISAGTATSRTITFSSPVPVSPSTDYHVVVRSNSNSSIYRDNTAGQGAGSSTNSGSSWSANNGPFSLSVTKIDSVSSQVQKASASNSYSTVMRDNFVGFSKTTTSSGGSAELKTEGVMSGLSGLTPGATYYISDTPGAISTSAGTNSRKVGLALSTTTLLIKHDNA